MNEWSSVYRTLQARRQGETPGITQETKKIVAERQPQTVQPESKASTGERVLATVGDFFGNIITGAAKGIEGIIDLGASVVGGIGGLFDKDFQNDVQDWVSNDWVGENIGNPIQEGTKASYLNDSKAGEIIEGIASGVGQMLPSIALTVATGGAAAPGMAVMAASAAGNATEEAYNQGAGYGQGLAYGALSGVVEAATEKIGGFVLGGGTSLVGKKLAGTALGKATSKGIGKVAETFVSEGAEEVLSDLANPALKYVTGVDKNIGQNYVDAVKGLPETFVIGGGAGAVLGGGQNFIQRARNRNRGGANATRADAQLAYAQELTENYGDDIVQNKRYDNAVHQIYEQASAEIKKMKPEQREKYLRSIGSQALAFNEDGSLRAKQAIDYNTEAMTASLRPVSGNLTFAPVQSNVAVNENAKQIKNVIEGVKKGAKVVVTDGLQGSNAAYYPEDDVFYVNNRVGEEDSNGTDTNNSGIKKLDNSLLNAIALHELTHKGEGTKAYNALAREISRLVNDPNAPAAIKAKLGDYEARLAWTKEAYANQGKTQAQKEYVVQTEMISDYLGDLLSDEYFVRKLGERNKSVTKRILSALEGLARGENKNVDPSVKKGLRKLYKAYVNTLDRAGYGVLVSEVDKEELEEERDFDNNGAKQYPETQTEQVRTETIRFSLMNNRAFKDNVQDILTMSDAKARAAKAADSYISVMKHTPDVILNNVEGAQDLEVIIRFDALYLAARADGIVQGHYHDLGAEITKRLPQLISDPDAIVRMDNGRLNIFAEMTTDKGNNGIIAIELNTVKDINSKNTKYNLVVSAFSAKDDYVRNALQKRAERVEYTKKDLSQVNHQLYEWLATINERSNGRFTTNNSISQTDGNVNPSDKSDSRTSKDDNKRYSRRSNNEAYTTQGITETDSKGRKLTAQQREFFKDTKAVDEKGRLLEVYHGSKTGDFTIFQYDSSRQTGDDFGKAYYFTTNLKNARAYAKDNHKDPRVKQYIEERDKLYRQFADAARRGESQEKLKALSNEFINFRVDGKTLTELLYDIDYDTGGTILKVYLNLRNPLIVDAKGALYRKVYPRYFEQAKSNGNDGIIVKNVEDNARGSEGLSDVYIAFSENQIKLTSNENPTADVDIRRSLARKDSEGKVLSQGQRDYFKDSKAVDEEGRLLRVYHGSKASPTVFSSDFISAGWLAFGKGFYFTEDKTRAQRYGKSSLYECYLNIKNPFISNDRAHLDLLYEKMNTTRDSILKYSKEKGVGGGELFKINYYLDDRGDDVSKYIRDLGFDGVIVDAYETKELIVYESNQIKLTTNHNPTKSEDIRFSLKAKGENISGEAEIKGDLVALHNLDERKLMKVLELGGFPMPSIAITRASLGHEQYGKITVVFGRETIDPQANRKNKVYPRDVWSPTVPKAEYKANEKVEDKIHKKYYELARKYGYDAVRPWYKYISDMEQQLANHEGEAGILEDMYDDASVMEIYLLDTEGKKIEPEKIVEQDRMSEEDIAYSKALLERFGDELRGIETGHFGQVRKFITDNREALIECLAEADSENHGKAYFEDADRLKQIVGRALRYRDNGPVTERVKFDYAKKESEVRKSVDKEKYKAWVDSYFKGIEEKKGVRNDVDVFTRSGNRRSFEATHEDYTLENIVDIMRQETQQGNSGWVGTTPSVLAAKLADEFASVEAIREAASSLKEFNEEMQENFNEVVRGMLTDISTLMTEGKRYIDDVERMTSMDSAERVIGEIADKRLFTEKQIADYMRREYPQSYTYTKEIGEKMISMFQYVRSMSDTDYFEAKPRRAVGLDEIKAVLLPNTASERVKTALTDKGIQYTQYDATDVNARREIIEKMENIRFSHKSKKDDRKFYYEMSRGEIKKLLANNTRMRVYAKKDIEQIINTVLDSYMSFGDKYGTLSNKNKAQVVDSLWQALNTAEKGKVGAVAIDAAEFIINSAVAEEMYEDYDRYEDVAIVNILRPYLNRINLDGIKGELLYIYDKEGFRAIRGRWGKRSDVTKFGIAPDELKLLLEDEGFHMAAEHPADVLAEVDSQYTNALARLKAKSKELFKDMLSAEEMKKLRQDIAREILIAADEKGAPSKLSKILEKYKKQLDAVKRRYDEVRHKNGAVNLLLDRVQKIKDIKSGAFLNATQYKSDLFKGSIEKFGRIKYRGNLNRVGTRKIFAALSEWYNAGNPMFKGMDGDQNGLRSNGVFNQEIKDMLDAIAQNEKPLTAAQEKTIAELEKKSGITDYAKLAEWYTRANVGTTYSSDVKRMLNELARPTEYSLQEVYAMQKIVQYFTHIIETYNMVLKNGKYVDAKELATRYIERAEKAKKVKTGVVDRIVQSRYGQAFMDPLSIMRNADRYDEHGFFTETFFELQEGIIRSQKLENDLKKDFEEFFKSHKKYAQDLSERKVKYNGVEMSLDEALSLYMTLKREQAQAGLVYSGLSFEERSGKRLGKQSKPVHVKGLVGKDVTGLTPEEIEQTAKAARDDLAKQFNETDMQFIAMLEKALNEDCKEIKRKTDTQRMGYSNVQEGYYYPIRRGYVASNVDSFNAQFEIDRVSNASFNKDTVKGAKGELYIEPVTRVFERHVRGIAQYAGLSTFIDNYNMLYNIDIGDNPNNVNNIRKTAEEVWKNNSQYIIKMLSDAQGIRKLDVGDKIIQRIRGAYVKFALGANPKVWLTQTTSLLAATSVLDVKNVVKGLSVKGADVDTYCDLAEIRNHDNTIALAQGVIDSIGKVGDFLMKPIGMVDRWVVKKLFGACQYQIQQNGGAKVGTIENKKAAGELLTRVILQTQQNSMVTERSSAMRSNSEVARTLTMFTSDAMKVIGRVVDAIGEYTVLKKDKAGADKMKAARRKTAKAVGALVSTSVFMALIAQAFKTLYNKDDEDENIAENMAVDMLGNMLGGLPLIKDVYARLMEGYEVSNYAYSTINNLLDSANNIFQAASDWISGDVDSKQTARNIKNMIYAAGQLLGIPVRNIYNVFDGLLSRFSASSAYKLDDLFYNQSYSSDLRKAIEEDDDEMASTIIGLMLNENIGDVTNENVRTELDRLVKSGHDVIPRSAPNSITYEGEEIALTAAQKRDFKQVYSEANNELASLVRLSAYRSASDDVKAKAVDIVYEMYFDLAVEDLIGEDLETKTVLFSKAFDIGKLALIVAQARLLTADKDDSGRSINGTKKAKIQSYINSLNLSAAEKYMIMGYLGYSNTYGEAQVQRYLRGIRGLTSTERQLLLEYSGYAA